MKFLLVNKGADMNVGFDIHGTLDNDGDGLLRGILESFLMPSSDGVEVFVISVPPEPQIKRELEALKIDYSDITIISVVDYLKRKGYYMWNTPRGWFAHPEVWWKSKGLICKEYEIDMIFDDLIQYKEYMPETTKFILWQGYRGSEYYDRLRLSWPRRV
jgi:hypothetical protein